MSQTTLIQNIGALATAVGNNQKLLAAATAAANSTAIAAGEAASEALAKAEQAMTAGGGGGEIESIATKSASLYCTADLLIENRQTILENISGDTLALENGRIVCKRDGHVIVTMHDYYVATSGTTKNYEVTIRGYTTKDGVSTQYRMVMGTGSSGPVSRFFSFTDILPVEAGTTIHGVVSAGLTGNSVLSITVTYLPSSGTDGKSAYDLAVERGFGGTEEAWLLALTDHRNPGELVYSLLQLNDPRLVLLDGALLATDGVYSETISTVIVPLSQTQPTLFCTEAEWQQSVTAYGVCGKFVLDTTAGTLRLPKVTGFVEGTLNAAALGSLVEAGLPNLSGGLSIRSHDADYNGAIVSAAGVFSVTKKTGGSVSAITTSSKSSNADNVVFSANAYNAIYGKPNTVQPQAIRGFIYMVFANGVKTPVLIEAENYVNDMAALRADVPQLAAHAAMPSDRRISLSLPASGSTVIAPADEYFCLSAASTAANGCVRLVRGDWQYAQASFGPSTGGIAVTLPVRNGAEVTVTYQYCNQIGFRFIYANGAE